MTLGLSNAESRARFVCPFCGMCHNWVLHGCKRPRIECGRCGRKLKIPGREDLCYCRMACANCDYKFDCDSYNEQSHECEFNLYV